MTLSAGVRLGPYEILAPIAAGGMGEVYRARDTRLDRIVAVKVLPSQLSASPDLRQRFEREARTISQLSHPHICALYDVGSEGGIEYLVMEFLEGETLAERLARGSLPSDQVFRHGIEIADALDKAHRQGIVHRDLKPGNVMLTRSGVKLVDFGLARFAQPLSILSGTSEFPTQTPAHLTEEGTIVGTIQYMAPEQLEGKDADARTDIFALGTVLYEMATGQKAFKGQSRASLIGAILKDEPPPLSATSPMSPPPLDRIVRACLAKDPEDRWQSARDVANELKRAREGSGSAAAGPDARIPHRRTRERLAWILVALSLAAAAAISWVHFRERPASARPIRFAVAPPEGTTFGMGPAAPAAVLSPDGRFIALCAQGADRKRSLWVHALDSLAPQKLVGTEDAFLPFWSPDSGFLGFFAGGKLKKIDVHGGSPQILCDALDPNGGTWSSDGTILFAPTREGVLLRVSANGGIPEAVTSIDRRRQEITHAFPQFLPDGRHFLYLILSGNPDVHGIYIASLDSRESKRLVNTVVRATYAPPDHLLFLKEGALMAQRFDTARLRLVGEPFRVADEVAYNPGNGRTTVSASDNGVLAYRAGPAGGVPVSELAWHDRGGKRIATVGGPALYMRPAVSPDEQRIAVQRIDVKTGTHDIWLVDEARSTVSRFTFGSWNSTNPVWSPDASRIAFSSDRDGRRNLYERASSGTGAESLLYASDNPKGVTDWSADGRYVAYDEQDPKTGNGIWLLPLFGDRKPIPFLRAGFNEAHAQFSPDLRWIAYSSDESGRREVYVQTFPGSGGKWQVSTAGGAFPRWRGDAKELFYLTADQKVMSVPVQSGTTFRAGSPQLLFETRYFNIPVIPYAVSRDGQRFLVNVPIETANASPLIVVLNWMERTKR